jgi:hypothetical protein
LMTKTRLWDPVICSTHGLKIYFNPVLRQILLWIGVCVNQGVTVIFPYKTTKNGNVSIQTHQPTETCHKNMERRGYTAQLRPFDVGNVFPIFLE